MANEVWETALPREDKVSEIADRAARERFITAKYVTKKYVTKNAALADDDAKYNALKSAATANDYVGLLKLVRPPPPLC